MGTGPFKLKNYVRGSYIEFERNPDYWKPGLPCLDGVKYFIIKDTSARAKALRSGRVDVEFRGFPPADAEAIKEQLGDKVVVAYPRAISNWGVALNVDKKPFDKEGDFPIPPLFGSSIVRGACLRRPLRPAG